MIASVKTKKGIKELVFEAYAQNKRLAVPLAGFPGADILHTSIKVAQQNHGMHYNCIEALVYHLKPDAAFMMMDLSVEANALGLPVRFPVHESSSVELHPVREVEDLQRLAGINILQDARIQSYIKTVEMMSTGFPRNVLVGAYVIGPVTLAGLLISAEQVAMDSVLDPQKLEEFCRFSTVIIQEYSRALINAGADIICILEPTGAILGPDQFRRFSGENVKHIMESYKYADVDTVYHVCGNTMHLLKAMAETGVDALSLDSPETGVNMPEAAEIVPQDTIVMGNINPTAVMNDGTPETVTAAVNGLMESMKPYPNFLLSTGCDLPPGTPLENMKAFMTAARRQETIMV